MAPLSTSSNLQVTFPYKQKQCPSPPTSPHVLHAWTTIVHSHVRLTSHLPHVHWFLRPRTISRTSLHNSQLQQQRSRQATCTALIVSSRFPSVVCKPAYATCEQHASASFPCQLLPSSCHVPLDSLAFLNSMPSPLGQPGFFEQHA